jgi:hypothetical protein
VASLETTVTVTVVVGPESVMAMEENEFQQYLLKLIREAINERDAVIIQPNSNQALILRDNEEHW